MPILPQINLGALNNSDSQKQMESIVAQLNEWARLVSNESKTQIIRGDQSTDAITIGQQLDGSIGLLMNDGENDRFFLGNEAD